MDHLFYDHLRSIFQFLTYFIYYNNVVRWRHLKLIVRTMLSPFFVIVVVWWLRDVDDSSMRILRTNDNVIRSAIFESRFLLISVVPSSVCTLRFFRSLPFLSFFP